MKALKNTLSIILIGTAITSCTVKSSSNMDKYIDTISFGKETKDSTTFIKPSTEAAVFAMTRELALTKDSLDNLKDSIDKITLKFIKVVATRDSINKANISNKEKLAVAEYKLLRIREYNRIAAQGNNLKFLRGWINRVIAK